MEEFVGLSPAPEQDVGESLRIVRHFDALCVSGAGRDALLRAAAVLADVTAATEQHGHVAGFDPTGCKTAGVGDPGQRGPSAAVPGGRVWLERGERPGPNDELIVERLAHALTLLETRRNHLGGFGVVIDESCSLEERATMLARLRIAPGQRIRLVATASDAPSIARHTAVVPTRYGLLRAWLDATGEARPAGRAGIGLWTRADHAPESWRAAVIAYRLGTPDLPVLDAADLGALLSLVRVDDLDAPHDDVIVLGGLARADADVLRVLVEAESVRSAAAELGLHHSTLQAKHRHLTHVLGYDPRTIGGRARYVVAEVLRRLHSDH